jgi:pilus assembly protein Flp/PilA
MVILNGGNSDPSNGNTQKETPMIQISTLIDAIRNLRTSEDESGQGLAEYGLILALVAVVAIVALTGLGTAIVGALSQIAGSL